MSKRRRDCLKKCLRRKISWFIGGGIISVLVSILIGFGVILPGAGTLIAILVGLGLLLFVSVGAVLLCLSQC